MTITTDSAAPVDPALQTPYDATKLLIGALVGGGVAGLTLGMVLALRDAASVLPETWTQATTAIPGLVAVLAIILGVDRMLVAAGQVSSTSDEQGQFRAYQQLRGIAPTMATAAATAYLLVALIAREQVGWTVAVLAYLLGVGALISLGSNAIPRASNPALAGGPPGDDTHGVVDVEDPGELAPRG